MILLRRTRYNGNVRNLKESKKMQDLMPIPHTAQVSRMPSMILIDLTQSQPMWVIAWPSLSLRHAQGVLKIEPSVRYVAEILTTRDPISVAADSDGASPTSRNDDAVSDSWPRRSFYFPSELLC